MLVPEATTVDEATLKKLCAATADDIILSRNSPLGARFYYLKGTDGKDAGAVDRAFNYTGKTDWKKLRIAYASNYFRRVPDTAKDWLVI